MADVLGVDRIRVLRTPIDQMGRSASSGTTGTTSWPRPWLVLGYERNTTTNRYLADEGIDVHPVVGESWAAAGADPGA